MHGSKKTVSFAVGVEVDVEVEVWNSCLDSGVWRGWRSYKPVTGYRCRDEGQTLV